MTTPTLQQFIAHLEVEADCLAAELSNLSELLRSDDATIYQRGVALDKSALIFEKYKGISTALYAANNFILSSFSQSKRG